MKKSNFFNVVREIDNFFINTISTKYIEIVENLSNKLRVNNFSLINTELYDIEKREKFYAELITNSIGFRLYFLNELNKHKKIDMAGRFQNNVGGFVNDKVEFLRIYKFSIAM